MVAPLSQKKIPTSKMDVGIPFLSLISQLFCLTRES